MSRDRWPLKIIVIAAYRLDSVRNTIGGFSQSGVRSSMIIDC